MTPSARLSAAIEVLSEIETARRPASDALKEWGLKRRFAGSSDRAAIAGLVYDALRRKASSAFVMGEATPRANLIGMLKLERGYDLAAIERAFDGARFAPAPLTQAELPRSREPISPARRRMSPAIIRNGSIRICSACSAKRARRRARRSPRARRSICASMRSKARATKRSR